jgi:DNA-binding response OmpR family regulator
MISLNREKKMVMVNDSKTGIFTKLEFHVLEQLCLRLNTVLSKKELYSSGGYKGGGNISYVITKIKEKLPEIEIYAVRGQGYKIQ